MRRIIYGVMMAAALLCSASTLAAAGCNLATLSGYYGYSATGLIPEMSRNVVARYAPFSEIAQIHYDGNGKVALRGTEQSPGSVVSVTYYGAYEVSDGCIGKATFRNDSGTIVDWHFVLVQGGNELDTMALYPVLGLRPVFALTFNQKKL